MEVYKTTVNAYKRLLDNPAHGEVCGVPTLVGTKTRKARVRATAVVESSGNSCKLLCMPHAGMASDVDVVRVAPGDGTVLGTGGVSIRTNAEHINSEFISGGVKGRLVAAQLCVSNITSQSNGVLYAACDQNRKDISGYEPVDIVTSIKEGNMVVASAQDEKVTVLYKPSQPEEIDEWVEDVQKGPYGGTRDINANSYPASHAVVWQGDNNTADYERPSGEQLTAYEEGTTVTLYDAGTSRSDLYLAGNSVNKVTSTDVVSRLDGIFSHSRYNYVSGNSLSSGVDYSTLRFGICQGWWTTYSNDSSRWTWTDAAGFVNGVNVDAGNTYVSVIVLHSSLPLSWFSGKTYDNIWGDTTLNVTNRVDAICWGYQNSTNESFKVACIDINTNNGNYLEMQKCYLHDVDSTTWIPGSTGYDDAFARARAHSGITSQPLFFFGALDCRILTNTGAYASSGTYKLKLYNFISGGLFPFVRKGTYKASSSITDLYNNIGSAILPTTSVNELVAQTATTELGPQEVLTEQGAPVDVVQQPAQPFEYSAEIQTVNVPQRLLVEFDAVYEYSGEDVLTSVTANPMRGKKDILPRTHNNVFASPLSGNQRAYRRYDMDSARQGSTKRKSMQ